MDNRYCLYHYGVKGMKWGKKHKVAKVGMANAFTNAMTGHLSKKQDGSSKTSLKIKRKRENNLLIAKGYAERLIKNFLKKSY